MCICVCEDKGDMDDWTRDRAGGRVKDDNEMKRDDGYVKNTNKGPRAG